MAIDVLKAKLVDFAPDASGGYRPVWLYDCGSGGCGTLPQMGRLVDFATLEIDGQPVTFPVYAVTPECQKGPVEEFHRLECLPPWGISNILDVRFSDLSFCMASGGEECPAIELTYEEGSGADNGTWTGELALSGGTLELEFYCEVSPIFPYPISFSLTYSGCVDPPITVRATLECANPPRWTVIDTKPFWEECCTDVPLTNPVIEILGRVRPVYAARLVDFAPPSSGGGGGWVSVWAYTECCPEPECPPAVPWCCPEFLPEEITATLTGSGTCGCVPGTVTLTYDAATGKWSGRLTGGSCGKPVTGDVTFWCEETAEGCYGFRLSLAVGINGYTDEEPTSCSCDPLSVTFPPLTITDPFICVGTITVTVTL